MAGLLGGGCRGVLPEPERDQQAMQFVQRRDSDTGRPDLHLGTGRWVEHPGPHHDNDPRSRLEVRNLPVRATLPVMHADFAPEQRVPGIMDDRIGPDMGRMTP